MNSPHPPFRILKRLGFDPPYPVFAASRFSQQTCSMSLAEEKRLVKEIEQLKQSKKTAAQYVTQEEVRGTLNPASVLVVAVVNAVVPD